MAKRRRTYYDDYWPRYESTRPIEVEDGIKAKSRRGKFVENWWASRWIAALKPLMDSGRLSRGRSYARRGQVIDIQVTPGHVTSRVQGSRSRPYRVDIQLEPLSSGQWDTVLDALAGQAIYAAQLLSGEMPADIDGVFATVGVPLFPASRGDLETDCSCPDWANPCKHIAAVYYLLGERFDQDPFLLFELRGRNREALAAALRERRAVAGGDIERRVAELPFVPGVVGAVDVPALESCLQDYWNLGPGAEDLAFDIAFPEVEMALLKRLGVPDFPGVRERNFRLQMTRVYGAVTGRALQLAYADPETSEAPAS